MKTHIVNPAKLVGVILLLLLIVLPISVNSYNVEVDVEGLVDYVVDGDTLYLIVEGVLNGKYEHLKGERVKVRLADVNAPELGTSEGEDSKRALKELIEGKRVYLDIDDVYVTDKYGRIVAIVYLPINRAELLNVNFWLVTNDYAEIVDYKNEFNPYEWSLHVEIVEKATTLELKPTVTVTTTTTLVERTTVEKTVYTTVTFTTTVKEKEYITTTTTLTPTVPAIVNIKTSLLTLLVIILALILIMKKVKRL